MSNAAVSAAPGGVLGRGYMLSTIGMCALIGIAAFESLAVTTVMPTISRELDGESLYSLSFAAPLATSLVGMVVAGNWADRNGPRAVVMLSMLFFGLGLLVVGTAPTMTVLLLGRLVQGIGSGALIVGLYVLVARLYPPAMHPSVFAGFAAAWVIPGLVGPVIAGGVTSTLGWHWVFLGALMLCVPVFAMIVPSLRRLGRSAPAAGEQRVPWSARRIAWAGAAAIAVVGLNLLSSLSTGLAVAVGVAALVVLAIAVRPLVPMGTLRAARGVPALVLLRGLVGAAFIGGDVYLPYLLSSHYGFAPAASGITLTLGSISWAGASWAQGRLGERVTQLAGIRIGIVLVLLGVTSAVVTAAAHLHPAVLIVGWALTGGGMGFMYPRFSVLTLRWSGDDERGFNSSALTIADSTGSAVILALTGAAFGLLGGADATVAFVGCFVIAGGAALLALLASRRAVPAER
jgi:MFS family permease